MTYADICYDYHIEFRGRPEAKLKYCRRTHWVVVIPNKYWQKTEVIKLKSLYAANWVPFL